MRKILGSLAGSIFAAGALAAAATDASLLVRAGGGAPQGPSGYHLKKKIKVGGEGGWDYITFDSDARRLFISRGTRVMVVDVDADKVVGEVPDTPGVHGIALAPSLARGFVSNGRGNNLTVFELKGLTSLGTIPAGQNPDAIVYDSPVKRVFAMNGRSGDVTVIDAATTKLAGTVPVGGKLESGAADSRGWVYVNVEDKSEIAAINLELQVAARWPLAPCEQPTGLAIDTEHHRLFAGCGNRMMAVVNTDNGKVVATPAICDGVDANAFDPGTGYAFASCGDGTLTVVHEDSPDKFSVVENVPTRPRARTMALDPKTHDVYLVTADFGPAPPPTQDAAHPRPPMLPDSFVVLVFAR